MRIILQATVVVSSTCLFACSNQEAFRSIAVLKNAKPLSATPTTDPWDNTSTGSSNTPSPSTTQPSNFPTTTAPSPVTAAPTAYICGGQVNNSLYTGKSQLVKSQSQQTFSTYSDCEASRAFYFGNAIVCSKNFSATLLGCPSTTGGASVVMEADFPLPILVANNQMEVPYDYYLNGVPNCAAAKAFLNSFTNNTLTTGENFTDTRATIQADCVNSTTVVIHILSVQ